MAVAQKVYVSIPPLLFTPSFLPSPPLLSIPPLHSICSVGNDTHGLRCSGQAYRS